MVAVAYRRRSFTKGFNCKALTKKFWWFGLAVAYKRVVAYERGSHMEVPLYFKSMIYQILQFIKRITYFIPR